MMIASKTASSGLDIALPDVGFLLLLCEIFQTYLLLKTTWAKAKNMWFGVCRIWIFTMLLEHLFSLSHSLSLSLCVCVCVCSVMFDFLWPHWLQPIRLLCPWDFAGNTGVCCHFLLRGIFPIQGFNLCLLHYLYWQVDSLPFAIWEDPFILYSVYIFFLIFTISIHARDHYLYYTAWKLNLREVKSVVQNHMTRTWYLNPSVINGTLNCKIEIIKWHCCENQKKCSMLKHCKGNRGWCRWSSLLFKTFSPAFELESYPVSEELNLPLGWIENLSVALADWGVHRIS